MIKKRYLPLMMDELSEEACLQKIITPRKTKGGEIFTTAQKSRQEFMTEFYALKGFLAKTIRYLFFYIV
jgi:hypothetical protein